MGKSRIAEILALVGVDISDYGMDDPIAAIAKAEGKERAREVVEALISVTGIEYQHPLSLDADTSLSSIFDETFLRERNIVPWKVDFRTIHLLVGDPSDTELFAEVSRISRRKVSPSFTDPCRIPRMIDYIYGNDISKTELSPEELKARCDLFPKLDDIEVSVSSPEAWRTSLIRGILSSAVQRSVAICQFIEKDGFFVIEFDGRVVFSFIIEMAKPLLKAILSLGDEGTITLEDRQFLISRADAGIRLEIIDNFLPDLSFEELGFSGNDGERITRFLQQPSGLFIVTGPKGSGRKTTIFRMTGEIPGERLTIALEKEVKYNRNGVIQVKMPIENTQLLENGLENLLKRKPDTLYLSDIPTKGSMKLLTRAALTGHFILGRLEQQSIADTINHLEKLGVPRYLLASGISGIVNQRLLKRLCLECRERISIDKLTEQKTRFLKEHNIDAIYSAKGCESCGGSGYRGHIGIFELFIPDHTLSKAISNVDELDELQRISIVETGMKPLIHSALDRLKEGLTTLEEVEEKVGLSDPWGYLVPTSEDSHIEQQSQEDSRGPFALILDDQRSIRMMVSEILENMGIATTEAENGRIGLSMLKNRIPDLIVLDIEMPVMNGKEFIKELKADENFRAIPVIMLTSDEDEWSERYMLDAGADDYVNKPFKAAVFVSRVRAVMRRIKKAA